MIVGKPILLAYFLGNARTDVLVGVKFMIGQIGTAKRAILFLQGVRDTKAVADMVFVTTGTLQPACTALHGHNFDEYLINSRPAGREGVCIQGKRRRFRPLGELAIHSSSDN